MADAGEVKWGEGSSEGPARKRLSAQRKACPCPAAVPGPGSSGEQLTALLLLFSKRELSPLTDLN